MPEHRLSGARWNRILDHGLKWYAETVDNLTTALLADGFPPFTEPRPPSDQYATLLAWRTVGDPRFWQSPEAQMAFEKLAQRFGPPPPLPLATGTYPSGGIV